jgi:hypothetical protein
VKTILSAIALLALAPAPAPQRIQHAAASIEINGVALRLGTSKNEVEQKYGPSEILKSSEDGWLIGQVQSLVHFTNGKLTFAERNWPNQDNDIGEQLFGVINSLNAEGFNNCKVFTDVKTDPAATLHRVWIDCGDKTILVVRYLGTSGKIFNTVDEHLGHLN